MSCAARFAGAFLHLEDAALGHPAEIVLDRRPPAGLHHVEIDGLGQAIGLGDPLLDGVGRDAGTVAVTLLVERIDAEGGAMGEERRLLVAGEGREPVPEIGLVLGGSGRRPRSM